MGLAACIRTEQNDSGGLAERRHDSTYRLIDLVVINKHHRVLDIRP